MSNSVENKTDENQNIVKKEEFQFTTKQCDGCGGRIYNNELCPCKRTSEQQSEVDKIKNHGT